MSIGNSTAAYRLMGMVCAFTKRMESSGKLVDAYEFGQNAFLKKDFGGKILEKAAQKAADLSSAPVAQLDRDCPPKAEVTGSNPVGRASVSSHLAGWWNPQNRSGKRATG